MITHIYFALGLLNATLCSMTCFYVHTRLWVSFVSPEYIARIVVLMHHHELLPPCEDFYMVLYGKKLQYLDPAPEIV